MQSTRWMAKTVVLCALLAGGVRAADVYLTTSDLGGTSSFNTSLHWSDGLAPQATNDYWVGGAVETVLRTVNNETTDNTFAGNSLTITNFGVLRYKGLTSTTTIHNLTVDGGILHNGNSSRTWTLLGGVTLGPNGATLEAESSDRTIVIPDPIVGTGGLYIWGPGKMILSGNNTYDGPTFLTNGTLQIGNGGTSGTLGAGNVTITGALVFSRSDDLVVSNLIAGTGTVTKNGAGLLQLTAANTYSGTTTINAGTLVLGGDNTIGTGLLDLRNNGTAIRSLDGATRTVTNALSISANIVFGSEGTGDLVFSGSVNNGGAAKELTISNAVTTFATLSNTGVLTIRGPGVFKLAANADIPNSSSITVWSGGTFDASATAGGFTNRAGKAFAGAGTVLGDFTANGSVSPGLSGPGTLTFSNNLSLAAATLNVDLAPTGTVGGGVNDLLDVAGSVAATGVSTVNVFAASSLAPAYTLLRYGGTLTGDDSNFTVGNSANFRQTFAFSTNVAGEIQLLPSSSVGSNLTWWGGAGTTWDTLATANWDSGAESFHVTDAVRFDNSAATTAVVLTGTLLPSAVLVDADVDYAFGGSGKISGQGAVVKAGSGTLTMSTANDYTGGTVVSNGILRIGNAAALGGDGGTTIAAGGTLDLNGYALNTRPGAYVISGNGYNATGAVINTGGNQQNAIRSLELAGDAMIAAWSNRWDVRSTGYGIDGINLNGHTLTKQGDGQISVVQQMVTNNGTIEVAAGNLTFTRSFVSGSGSINLSPGTVMMIENSSTGTFSKAVSVTGATLRLIGNSFALQGPVSLSSPSNAVEVNAALTYTWAGAVSGDGSIAKRGAGTLTLNADSGYTGTTTVEDGTLLVNGAYSGGGLFNVLSNAVLGGTGSVAAVTVDNGGHLAPGNSPGTFTMGDALTLNDESILDFELAAPNAATGGNGSDFITGVAGLTLDGVLNVVPLTGFTTTLGSSWRIIGYSGSLSDQGLAVGSAPVLDDGLSYAISTDSEAVYLTVIPEPGSVGLLLCAGLAVLARTRRRR